MNTGRGLKPLPFRVRCVTKINKGDRKMTEEIVNKLERIFSESEKILTALYAKGDYSDSGKREWDNMLKLRDLTYDAYTTALFYREEV